MYSLYCLIVVDGAAQVNKQTRKCSPPPCSGCAARRTSREEFNIPPVNIQGGKLARYCISIAAENGNRHWTSSSHRRPSIHPLHQEQIPLRKENRNARPLAIFSVKTRYIQLEMSRSNIWGYGACQAVSRKKSGSETAVNDRIPPQDLN